MTTTGQYSQHQLARIGAALANFEERELRRRRLDAEQLIDLAAAMEAAVGESVPSQSDRELGYRSLRLELAALLHESEGVADRLLQAAHIAQQFFPGTLEALSAGQISLNHLKVITHEGGPLIVGEGEQDRRRRSEYEAAVVGVAREESPNRLRPIARKLAAAQLEETLVERHEREVARRFVRVVDGDNGVADLTAYLPAEEAHAIYDRLTRVAKRVAKRVVQRGAGQAPAPGLIPGTAGTSSQPVVGSLVRSVGEARADVFRDLLLGLDTESARTATAIRGQIQVVIPVELLGGAGGGTHASVDGPAGSPAGIPRVAELVGHGPIDAATARRLAGEADAWERITVDDSGVVLSVDRYPVFVKVGEAGGCQAASRSSSAGG